MHINTEKKIRPEDYPEIREWKVTIRILKVDGGELIHQEVVYGDKSWTEAVSHVCKELREWYGFRQSNSIITEIRCVRVFIPHVAAVNPFVKKTHEQTQTPRSPQEETSAQTTRDES